MSTGVPKVAIYEDSDFLTNQSQGGERKNRRLTILTGQPPV
jgi:hypothetical protein